MATLSNRYVVLYVVWLFDGVHFVFGELAILNTSWAAENVINVTSTDVIIHNEHVINMHCSMFLFRPVQLAASKVSIVGLSAMPAHHPQTLY